MTKHHAPVVAALLLGLLLSCLTTPASAQASAGESWHGKQCAVVLTYDDALTVHLDIVRPLLDSLGLKGTFYVAPSFPGFQGRTRDWMALGKAGHELGNHSMFHPCNADLPGRSWVPAEYNLAQYTVRRMSDEAAATNAVLSLGDERQDRTFAYPCGDTTAGGSSYVDVIRRTFVGARGVQGRFEHLATVNLYDIGSFMIQGQSGDDLIHLVERAAAEHALVVFLFHGVGGEHSINVSADAHRALALYLKAHAETIWVAPLRDVASYITEQRQGH